MPHSPNSTPGPSPAVRKPFQVDDRYRHFKINALEGAPNADPAGGLTDASPDAASESAPGPSLWARIRRAFQYGSQGGER